MSNFHMAGIIVSATMTKTGGTAKTGFHTAGIRLQQFSRGNTVKDMCSFVSVKVNLAI